MSQEIPDQSDHFEREDLVDGLDVDSGGRLKSNTQKAIYGQESYEDVESSWTDNQSSSTPWFDG